MTASAFMESASAFLAILTPLVVVPLTIITFYLRSLREHQATAHGELIRRAEKMEGTTERLTKTLAEFERDYTTKEEWLRETMWARRNLEQLRDMTVCIETLLQSHDRESNARFAMTTGASGANVSRPTKEPPRIESD